MTSRRTLGILVGASLLTAVPAGAQRGPAPAPTGLPAEVLSLACAPTLTHVPPVETLHITGGQDATARRTYHPGDLITIGAGTRDNITVGQQFFVRRTLVSRDEPITPKTPGIIRTAGWIQVYAVDDAMSLATIVHACDTVNVGDYLEPFAVPAVPTPKAERPAAERENYARVMMGQDRRRLFARGDYLTIDRGSNHGVSAGAHFVLYRDKHLGGNFLFELGEAVVMTVSADSATLQVTSSLDAIQEGDYAAMRR